MALIQIMEAGCILYFKQTSKQKRILTKKRQQYVRIESFGGKIRCALLLPMEYLLNGYVVILL